MPNECEIDSLPSIKGNFFQSVGLYRVLNQIGWKTFALSFPKKSSHSTLVAYAPKQVPLYSSLFPRFQVFYGPAVGENLDILDSLLKRLCSSAKSFGALSLFVRTPFPYPYGYEVFKNNGFERELGGGECSILIDLEKDHDTLWKDVKRFARRCVNGALQNNVEVKSVETEEELRQFHRIYVNTGCRRGFYPYSFSLFEALWKQLEPEGMVKFFIARWKEKPIAGILNTFYQRESIPWIACSLDEFWKLHPNHLLFWHSICWSKEAAGSSIFKLYHLPARNQRGSGVDYYTFKTCFGGRLIEECAFYTKILSPAKSGIFQIVDKLPKLTAQKILLSVFSHREKAGT